MSTKKSSHKLVKHGSIAFSPKLMKKSDLIVLFDHEKSYSIISEAWIAKVPVITFMANNNFRDSFIQNSYFVNGNFKSVLTTFDKNIFFISLNFLFKDLKKKKKSFVSVSPKSNLQLRDKTKKKSIIRKR